MSEISKPGAENVASTTFLPFVVQGEGNLHLPVYGQQSSMPTAPARTPNRPAVFLDRDGVLIEDVGFLKHPAELRVLPGVSRGIRLLQSSYWVIVVTNQSGIARGLFGEPMLLSIHTELVRRLAAAGARIDAFYYCPHLLDSELEDYRVDCDCRKPKPGMLLKAASDWGIDLQRSFIVGDAARDITAGRVVGVTSVMVGVTDAATAGADVVVPDLEHAARFILDKTLKGNGVPAMPGLSRAAPGRGQSTQPGGV